MREHARPGTRLALALVVCAAVAVHPAAAQEDPPPAPCSASEHRQFDFWIGEWEVVSTADGQVAGSNSIRPVMNGCALEENWRGAGGGHGTSLNVYDAREGKWHQTWISDNGFFLRIAGGIEDDSMVMSGEMAGPQGGTALHRIVWTPLEGGDVRQVWRVSRDGGETWNLLFDGTYRRQDAAGESKP